MRGTRALEVYQAMYLHIKSPAPYDGFKYNFRMRKAPDLESLPRAQQYGFMMVERDNTDDTMSLVKYWYPLFAMNKYTPKTNSPAFMGTARKSIKDFEFLLEEVRAKLDEFETPDDSMGAGGLPKLYYFGNTTAENFYLVAGLFLKFPQLNNMTCSDPLGLYAEFKQRLDIHKQFLSLYL